MSVPTLLAAAGLPDAEPSVNGIQQAPMGRLQHGIRLRRRPMRPRCTILQYFEMFCNRGIYHQGWTAVTRHGISWELTAALAPSR